MRCAVTNNESTRRWREANPEKVKEGNDRRISVGKTYIGREGRFPAPREAVEQFARELIEGHRQEANGTHG